METKHTPGPWAVRDIFQPSSHGSIDIYNNDGRWIGEALGTHVGPPTKEEARANAYLIAAAPDLLDALTELLECDYTSGTHLYCAQIKAQAAIGKATGRLITPVSNQ